MTDVSLDQASARSGQTSATVGPGALNYVPVQHTALKNAEIIPMSLRSVHFVMPGGVDDRSAPSGGNAYDRRVCLDLLADPIFDALITGESDFAQLPEVMPRLTDGSLPALCHRVRYDDPGAGAHA